MRTVWINQDEWYPVRTLSFEKYGADIPVSLFEQEVDDLVKLQDKVYKAFNKLQNRLIEIEKTRRCSNE